MRRPRVPRTKLFHRRFTRPGAPPGEFHGEEAGDPPRMRLISYDADAIEERELAGVAELDGALKPGRVSWIDVQGLGDGELVRQLGERFALHPLALADVVNTGQRPKADEYDTALYCVVRQAMATPEREVRWEQFSLFLGEGWVLSLQEHYGDCLEPVRERLRKGRKVLRSGKADYLACMLLDALVDGYFPALEVYGERLEELEVDVMEHPTRQVLARVYRVKRELMAFRRASWPLRDVLSRLLRDEESRDDPWIGPTVLPYLRDTADHAMQVVDILETYRELAGSFVDVYLSSISNRTNEVMRVLTVIATIFIPLTFIAGIYGMNFDTHSPWNLPELSWRYGYPIFWAVCVIVAGMLLYLFRRLGWLGSR